MNNTKDFTVSDLINLFLFHIKSIILVSICAALATFGCTYYLSKPVYSYTGSMMIYTSLASENNVTITQAGQAFVLASYYVDTYVDLLQSNSFCAIVQDEAVENLVQDELKNGSDKSHKELTEYYKSVVTPAAIKTMTSFSYQDEVLIFSLSVRSETKNIAKYIASAMINNAPDFSKLYGESCELKVVDDVTGSVSVPSPVMYAIFAFGISVVIMTLIFFTLNSLDRRIKDEISLGDRFDVPVLGIVPDFNAVYSDKSIQKETK